jgi:hypothetical protein
MPRQLGRAEIERRSQLRAGLTEQLYGDGGFRRAVRQRHEFIADLDDNLVDPLSWPRRRWSWSSSSAPV